MFIRVVLEKLLLIIKSFAPLNSLGYQISKILHSIVTVRKSKFTFLSQATGPCG